MLYYKKMEYRVKAYVLWSDIEEMKSTLEGVDNMVYKSTCLTDEQRMIMKNSIKPLQRGLKIATSKYEETKLYVSISMCYEEVMRGDRMKNNRKFSDVTINTRIN